MKFTFAACLVAAGALAQEASSSYSEDYPSYDYDYTYEEETSNWTDKIPIEQNAEGNFELVLPELQLPAIEFANVDKDKIMGWLQEKKDQTDQWNSDFKDAWRSYTDAVAQPWDNFVTRAEDLMIEGKNMDAQTSEEVIRFVSDNTFMDGRSLSDIFPNV